MKHIQLYCMHVHVHARHEHCRCRSEQSKVPTQSLECVHNYIHVLLLLLICFFWFPEHYSSSHLVSNFQIEMAIYI